MAEKKDIEARRKKVARLAEKGLSNKKIAEELGVSASTVSSDRKAVSAAKQTPQKDTSAKKNASVPKKTEKKVEKEPPSKKEETPVEEKPLPEPKVRIPNPDALSDALESSMSSQSVPVEHAKDESSKTLHPPVSLPSHDKKDDFKRSLHDYSKAYRPQEERYADAAQRFFHDGDPDYDAMNPEERARARGFQNGFILGAATVGIVALLLVALF